MDWSTVTPVVVPMSTSDIAPLIFPDPHGPKIRVEDFDGNGYDDILLQHGVVGSSQLHIYYSEKEYVETSTFPSPMQFVPIHPASAQDEKVGEPSPSISTPDGAVDYLYIDPSTDRVRTALSALSPIAASDIQALGDSVLNSLISSLGVDSNGDDVNDLTVRSNLHSTHIHASKNENSSPHSKSLPSSLSDSSDSESKPKSTSSSSGSESSDS